MSLATANALDLRRPDKCPRCGSSDIGWLSSIDAEDDREYENLGGLYYCVTCGWGEDDSIFPKCDGCSQPIRTKEERKFAEDQDSHPGVLGLVCPSCYNKQCERQPDTPWTDPVSGEVDYEAMQQDLGVETDGEEPEEY